MLTQNNVTLECAQIEKCLKKKNVVSVFRYVGENYSHAQEAMEDAMRSFYSQGSSHHPLSNPLVGQLVAVRGEDGDEMARAQVTEITSINVKVTRPFS